MLAVFLLARLIGFFLGPRVPAVPVVRQDLVETLVVNGRVLAPSRASLGTEVTGTVRQVLVEEGASVAQGEPLIQLNEEEAQAAFEKAAAELRQAETKRAELSQVLSRLKRESLEQARATLEKARRKVERLRSLHRQELVSSSDLEDATLEFDLAQSRLAAAEVEVRSYAPGGIEEKAAEANLEAARSAYELARVKLARCRVIAPAPGRILTRSVEPGDVVQPGRTLLTMALEREIQLLAQPDEKNLRVLKTGQKALASADAFPGDPFEARVFYISPSVDLNRGTVDVKLSAPNPPSFLKPDMTLSVEIETGRKPQAFVIPLSVIRDLAKNPWVLTVEKGRAMKRHLVLGVRSQSHAEVIEGLAEGDLVLEPGKPKVQPGMRVRPLRS